jgi:hypothetical protein
MSVMGVPSEKWSEADTPCVTLDSNLPPKADIAYSNWKTPAN